MANVYILYSSKIDKYYIGACIDMERRLYEHNIGHSKFTATGLPWELKYTESYPTLQEAKKRELQIKKMKSRKYIEKIIAHL
jgi:putative endonuclease